MTNTIKLFRYLFWFTDTTLLRLVLGVSSLLFAIALALPDTIFDPDRFAVTLYVPYRTVWIVLFLLHFLGVFWRLIDARHRVRWALTVNSLGCVLWLGVAISTFMVYGFSLSVVVEGMLGILSVWVLYRTGLTPEIVTP